MGNRINVKNAGYATVTTNSASEYVIGQKTDLSGLMNIDLAFTLSTGKLYGDGVITSNQSQITGATLKVALNKIPITDRAVITGSTITNGILDVTTDDNAPQIAFYAETEADDGTKEQLWLLCGKAQPIGITGKQKEDNLNYSTDEMTINFIARMKDKKVLRMGDTSNSAFTSVISNAFASDPDATGTI